MLISGMQAAEPSQIIPYPSFPDVASVPKDLESPQVTEGEPAPGRRVRQAGPGYESTEVHHTLYLPVNWNLTNLYPVIVEYPGNAYAGFNGDSCSGTVEGSNLGYGISGGSNYLWLCLPFVETVRGHKQNATRWWGDINETVAYCTNNVPLICRRFHGNTNAIILTGFSRGAIACNFIGLHDDAVARLWRAFIPFSHYDGVKTNWPYPGADRASAQLRLNRLEGRPQCICEEQSTTATRTYLEATGIAAPFTFVTVPFRNHSDEWVLRKSPARHTVREWLITLGLP
jgi:hypothetical protein